MIYNCPECGSPLRELIGSEVSLWCGNGQCKSLAANFGADGKTREEAYSRLFIKIEKEWGKEWAKEKE